MKIIQYVEWTEPGEKQRFLNLIPTAKNTMELKEKIMQEFGVDKTTANILMLRFKKEINQIYNS